MPCDSITTQSVVLKNAIPNIVDSALREAAWYVTGATKTTIRARKSGFTLTWEKGKGITITGMRQNQNAIDNITREYSKQAVSWAATRAGWQVKSTGSNTLTVSRR